MNVTVTTEPAGPASNLSPNQRAIRIGAWTFVVAAAVLVALTAIQHRRLAHQREDDAHAAARAKTADAERFIEGALKKVSPVATALAADLSSGALKPADVPARLRADLQKNGELFEMGIAYAPYAFDPKVKLYAPHAARAGAGVENFPLEQRYDYTSYDWYTAGLKGGWGEPYYGGATKRLVVGYAVPIFRPGDASKTPIGVARVNVTLDTVRDLVSSVSLGQTGYGFLISKGGVLLSYPIEEYVRLRRKMVDISRELKDPVRVNLTERALRGESTEGVTLSGVTRQSMYLVQEPIDINGWVFGVAIFPEEVSLDARDQRRGFIRIAGSVLLLAFAVSLVVFRVERGGHQHLWAVSVAAGAILACGI